MEADHPELKEAVLKEAERGKLPMNNQKAWERFLKLQLIHEILCTGKQK